MRAIVAIIVVALTALCLAQSEISKEEARKAAQRHLRTYFGIELDMSTAGVVRIPHKRRHAIWEVEGTKGPSYAIQVDAVDGSFRGFTNGVRRWQQYKNKGRTGKEAFTTEVAWRNHLQTLGRHLGVPETATLGSITWKRDGQVKDANSAGYVGGTFRDHSGKAIAIINCDPQDGVLVMFTRED